MAVVTRFAPSPTGFLHIGGARTALFNWLYAKHHGGRFVLRIEDTDRARSTEAAVAAIHDGLRWLGLDWDGEPVRQSARADRHFEVAQSLLDEGKAYRCYCTQEELAEMRERARAEGRTRLYDGRWRDRDPGDAPNGVAPVIRFKAPLDGETAIDDLVQGRVTVANSRIDDMILARADGTPTYMLSVVVDDHDMGVTHIIRGDDHLTNAFRQFQLYDALDWHPPAFAHIPLIHGADGAKLSKRHGALGIDAYREMGYLPETLRNYLLRLGWSHGDDEVISTAQAIQWFGLDAVGRAPARFDIAKLDNLNGRYLRATGNDALLAAILPILEADLEHPVDAAGRERLLAALDGLKARADTTVALANSARFYVSKPPLAMTDKAVRMLDSEAKALLIQLATALKDIDDWSAERLEDLLRDFARVRALKLGKVAQPLRAALTGSTTSPSIFEVMAILGPDQVHARLESIQLPDKA